MKPLSSVVTDFDRIAKAMAVEARPDALTSVEKFVLPHVPPNVKTALDVGCGDGAMTRALAARGIDTVGIDISPGMIDISKRGAEGRSNLRYRVVDPEALAKEPERFDLVVSVAMVHHVPLDRVVPLLASLVAKGGTLIIQDVMERSGLRSLPVNGAAWLYRRLRRLHGAPAPSAAIAELHQAHGDGETYLDQSAVKPAYEALLPGCRVFFHPEWRYTCVWREASHAGS